MKYPLNCRLKLDKIHGRGINMEYYMINEVAKMHSVTKRTLLYYERIGIFMPHHVDEKTGYRYYVYEQFPFLKQIIYLKDLGLSLEDIQELLEHREFKPLIEMLQAQLSTNISEQNALAKVEKDLKYLIDYYEQVQHLDERDLNKPGIKLFNDRHIFYTLADENNSRGVMMAYRKILRKLIEEDKFSQMHYGTIILNTESFYDKIGSFISLPYSFGFENEIIQKAGKYAYMYKKGGYYDPESLKVLLKWIEDNGYEVDGDIYDYSLVDYTFTKSEEEMIQEIQIKVK